MKTVFLSAIVKPAYGAPIPGGNGGPGGASRITNPALSESIRGLSGLEFLARFLPMLITLFLIIASLLSFFFLIWGGIRWITSGGDPKAVESARGQVTMAIIGLVIVFVSFVIFRFIGDFFGINLLELTLPTLTG